MLKKLLLIITTVSIVACTKGTHPEDPYENLNRKVFKFNKAFDATVVKPPVKVYKAILPPQVRKSVSNFYNNLQMLPTIANDMLQGELLVAYKDSWRLLINSTIGVAGLFDAAEKMSLPPHHTDLGVTLAKWGDKKSPYLVLPFLGPSTIRDTAGWAFDFSVLSIYGYITPARDSYALALGRYVDIRAALLDNEQLLGEALDEYSFVRDAYLQNRNYQIQGEKAGLATSLYIEATDEEEQSALVESLEKEQITSAPAVQKENHSTTVSQKKTQEAKKPTQR